MATWLGPQASQATRERVRLMQRRAFEVQLAAPQEYESAEVAVDLGAITAPALVVSGGKDLPDFRLIAARLAALLPGARPVELPWAGHLPTLERPHELSAMLTVFLREHGPGRVSHDGQQHVQGLASPPWPPLPPRSPAPPRHRRRIPRASPEHHASRRVTSARRPGRTRISPGPLQVTVGRSQSAGSALSLAAVGLRGSLGGALLRERLLG